jgi:uncharacterized phage protein (TIGR02220 family)
MINKRWNKMGDTYYFSHDYTARDDEKIQNLIYEFGYEAYGLYWAIVEMLYKNGGYLELNYKRIAFGLSYDKAKIIEKIINDFDLFKVEEDRFYSESALKRLAEREQKSKNGKKAAKIRWAKEREAKNKENEASNADAMRPHSESTCDRNAIKESKVKESKVKESKVKESKQKKYPYKKIVTYLNEKAEKNYKSTTKKTKELIRARVDEGFELQDFYMAIDNKVADWKGDAKWDNYLRPATLFNKKNFEGYVNENPRLKGKNEMSEMEMLQELYQESEEE